MRFEFKIILLSFAVMFGFAFPGQVNALEIYTSWTTSPVVFNTETQITTGGDFVYQVCIDRRDELITKNVTLPDGTVQDTTYALGPLTVYWASSKGWIKEDPMTLQQILDKVMGFLRSELVPLEQWQIDACKGVTIAILPTVP